MKNSKLLISAFKLQNNIINILTKTPFKLQHDLCFEIMKLQFHDPEPTENPEVQVSALDTSVSIGFRNGVLLMNQ